jgi:OFA family oxalate/formate antiporter-like MFS transporter
MGLTLLGIGISPLITAPIMSTLIFTVGPLQTFIYFGIASLVILSVFSLPLKFPPDSSSPSTKQVTTTSQEKHLNRA